MNRIPYQKDRPIRPLPLMAGDRVGIVAPAGAFGSQALTAGLDFIRGLGLTPVLPQGLDDRKGYLAAGDDHRVAMLHAMFADPDIQGIICVRGGYGSLRILEQLDLDLIMQNPKVFVGYSDITALLLVLYQGAGLVTFHGPMVTGLPGLSLAALSDWCAVLAGRAPVTLEAAGGRVICRGDVQAPLMGGNLTTICHLLGTPFQPVFDRHILFLEDRGEAPYRLDRMLTQMRLAGCFDRIAGLVLGAFTACGDAGQVADLLTDCFKDLNVPVMTGFPIGHTPDGRTLPIGPLVRLRTDQGLLTCNYMEND